MGNALALLQLTLGCLRKTLENFLGREYINYKYIYYLVFEFSQISEYWSLETNKSG